MKIPHMGTCDRRSRTTTTLAFAAVLTTVLATAAQAGIEPTPFRLFQGNSPLGDDPRVIFGFNPQPEPPADPGFDQVMDLSTPGQVTISNSRSDGTDFTASSMFDLYLGIALLPAVHVKLGDANQVTGAASGVTTLQYHVMEGDTGAALFELSLDFMTSSGGLLDPASIVGFNPQPEPPAIFGPDGATFFSFGFTSYSDVSVTLRLLDAQNNPVTLTPIPEPRALAMFCLGLVVLCTAACRRQGRGWPRAPTARRL